MDHFLKYGNVFDHAQFLDAYHRLPQPDRTGDQTAQPRPKAARGELQALQDLRLDDSKPRAQPSGRKKPAGAGTSQPTAKAKQKQPAVPFEEQVHQDFERWLTSGEPEAQRAQAADRMEYAELEQARTLKLDGLSLGRIPAKVGQFGHLRELRIGGNQLDHLPAAITRLEQLQTLDARENRMTELPPKIGRLTALKCLNVDSNQLTSLPNELAELAQLETLSAHSNQLKLVPSRMGALKKLRTLHLSNNQLWELPGTWGALFRLLEDVDLSHNRLQALPATCEPPARKLKLNVEANDEMVTLPVAYGGFAYRALRISTADDHKLKNVDGKLTVKTKGTGIRQGLVNESRLPAGRGIERGRLVPARNRPRAAPLHDNDSISTCSELSFVRDHAAPGEIEGIERVGQGAAADPAWGAQRLEAWVEPLAERYASRHLSVDASAPAPVQQSAPDPWDTARADLFDISQNNALPPTRHAVPPSVPQQLQPDFLAALYADLARLPEPQASAIAGYLDRLPAQRLVSALEQMQLGTRTGAQGAVAGREGRAPISVATTAAGRANDAATAWFAAEPSFGRDRAV